MKRAHYAMLAVGLFWFAAVLWLVASNSIAREIRPVEAIAEILDKLPPVIGTPIFVLFWFFFLLGWVFLLALGVRPLFRRGSQSPTP